MNEKNSTVDINQLFASKLKITEESKNDKIKKKKKKNKMHDLNG